MKFKVLRNPYLGKVIVNWFGGFPQKSVALYLLSLSPYLILLFIELDTNKRDSLYSRVQQSEKHIRWKTKWATASAAGTNHVKNKSKETRGAYVNIKAQRRIFGSVRNGNSRA